MRQVYFGGEHAEQAVLGSLLLDNTTWEEVGLQASDFASLSHREIFEVIKKLLSEGKNADMLCVADVLAQKRLEKNNASFIELCDICKMPFSPKNIRHYVDIVKRQAIDRELLILGQEIIASVQEQHEDRLAQAQSKLQNITESHSAEVSMPSEIIKSVVEAIDQRQSFSTTGVATGFSDLDNLTHGLQNGHLILIAGRPSMGKTLLGVNIAEHIAVRQKKSVVIFSMEMSKRQLMERLLASVSGLENDAISYRQLTDNEVAKFVAASAVLSESFLFIDDKSSRSVAEMKTICRRIKKAHGLSLVLVDYITLLSAEGENETLRISNISRELKMLARDLNVPVIAISQLNRNVESRVDKRPYMADLRQSGAIEQDADLILFIYRDEVYYPNSVNRGIAEIIIAKHRTGPLGTVYLKFNGKHSRFDNCQGKPIVQNQPIKNTYRQAMDY